MRAARLAWRGYWDLGFIKACSVCGLLVPVYTDGIELKGCPVTHFPALDSDAYVEGGYCRGGQQPAIPPSGPVRTAAMAPVPFEQREPQGSDSRDDWHTATIDEMREHLDRIGPPWGNSWLLASHVIAGFWVAYEALDRLEPEARAE